jgi:type I restriction enzyme S subunit
LIIPVPPLDEQISVAGFLSALDDKIELNQKMNKTLDAMARALFKSWFVDFDPVRAKAGGRDTGLPAPVAALFPAYFEGSEFGEIPRGWRLDPIGVHVEAAKGVSYKGEGLADSGMPMHNLNSVYEGGGYKHEGIKYYSGEFHERHVARPGDLIVANTEQGHDRLLIGYAAIVPERFGPKTIFSHHIYRVRACSGSPLTEQYLCHLLNSERMHDLVSGYANGTTVNMLPIDGLQKPPIVVPPSPLVSAFDLLATAISGRLEALSLENETLAETRDGLLPKLISGEVRVSNKARDPEVVI